MAALEIVDEKIWATRRVLIPCQAICTWLNRYEYRAPRGLSVAQSFDYTDSNVDEPLKDLHKLPLPILGLDSHLTILVNTDPSGLENRCRSDGIPECRQSLCVQVLGRQFLSVDGSAAVDKLFKRHISVSAIKLESVT